MADHQEQEYHERRHEESDTINVGGHEVKERGIFDLMGGKKEEVEQKPVQEDRGITTELEKAHLVSGGHQSENKKKEEEEEDKKPSLIEKLHRSHGSSSSSSSDEEDGEGGEKKKKKKEKKKGLDEEDHEHKIEETATQYNAPLSDHGEEKKGFIEKIKEKLPGGHKELGQVEEVHNINEGEEAKENKGILEKIKEKLPGHHKDHGEEEKQN